MRRITGLTLAAIAATAISGCATMNVSSHVERGLDISRYQTYDWGPADALPTGDARLDKDPFFKDHVQGAVEKSDGRQRSGFGDNRNVRPSNPLPREHQRAHRHRPGRRQPRLLSREGCTPATVSYEAGTLVIDVLDARTNRLLWRGWAQNSVKGMLENQDTMARQIDEAAARMFERFPRPL